MDHFELIVLGLLIAVAGLTALARVIDVPYPILLVVGGSALGFVPGLPRVELDPDIVLLIFLPPLLFHAAYFASLRELRADARSITLNAVGLVLLTATAVAVVAHAAIDGLSWAAAFTLGAVVSPTDPLAATAIMHRLGVPARMVAIIEGESLVNDGSALVIYRTAVAAAVGGSFDLLDATWDFIVNVAGGIAIGLVVGRALVPILRAARVDPTLLVTLSLLNGYLAYIPAEEIGVSGVLAAVVVGLVLGRHSAEITTATARINGYGFWEILVFLLNAVLFVLTGFQFAQILADQERAGGTLLALAAAISLTVIVTRIVWLNTMPYVIRAVDRRPSQRGRRVGWRLRSVAAWSGLRGAVSLAAALALPQDFPERDLVVFLSLSVIFTTLVLQGLTLPPLIRALGVHDDGTRELEEVRARRAAAEAAIERLRTLREEDWTRTRSVDLRIGFYEFRLRRLGQRAGASGAGDGDLDDDAEARSRAYQRMLRESLEAERWALLTLRAEGELSDEVMHRLERELDLEDQRLDI
jgi:CPA1 family monovalent cation:H+ antiporter